MHRPLRRRRLRVPALAQGCAQAQEGLACQRMYRYGTVAGQRRRRSHEDSKGSQSMWVGKGVGGRVSRWQVATWPTATTKWARWQVMARWQVGSRHFAGSASAVLRPKPALEIGLCYKLHSLLLCGGAPIRLMAVSTRAVRLAPSRHSRV